MPIDRRAVVSGALAGAAMLLSRRSLAASDPMSKQAVLHDPQVPALGNPNGDVTIVEYFDYQCPFCKKAYPDILKLVRDDGRIRLVMKDWPIFGSVSRYASQLALAAGDHHAQALDALMRTRGRLTVAEVDETLGRTGFDVAALRQSCGRQRRRIDGILVRNAAQAEGFGLAGTPAYLVETVLFPGPPDLADVRRAIAAARTAGH
ncbi:DsbA family protein [Aurantimonas sp. MSK8Z-1]|nr:DsbA family protein [Aurantimonas sp. MSK8Z-1]MCW4115439.1 DsbA family protein [Aurantimonas sp. MSK8Z-1]